MNELKMNTYAYKPIIERAGRDCNGKYDINYSSILTRLIQEAGRFCEYYASDLFIDWSSVMRYIDTAEAQEKKTFFFGFRQMGVDGNSFVESRFTSGMYADPEKEYRSLCRLDIDTDGDEMEMTLGRVF